MAPGPKSKKEASANALAAFHHVVAKGQIERVKDFVVVRTPTFSLHARLPLPAKPRDARQSIRLHVQGALATGPSHVLGRGSQHAPGLASSLHGVEGEKRPRQAPGRVPGPGSFSPRGKWARRLPA
jgi:hypothetical protein